MSKRIYFGIGCLIGVLAILIIFKNGIDKGFAPAENAIAPHVTTTTTVQPVTPPAVQRGTATNDDVGQMVTSDMKALQARRPNVLPSQFMDTVTLRKLQQTPGTPEFAQAQLAAQKTELDNATRIAANSGIAADRATREANWEQSLTEAKSAAWPAYAQSLQDKWGQYERQGLNVNGAGSDESGAIHIQGTPDAADRAFNGNANSTYALFQSGAYNATLGKDSDYFRNWFETNGYAPQPPPAQQPKYQ